ncbi:metalloprotease TldD [Thiolapillus sp.]
MSNTLTLARETLLSPAGITDHHLQQVMDKLISSQVDAADLYFQYSRLESWVLDDGIIKEGNFNLEQGAGLRAISGEKTGFAYTEELNLENLLEAADSARTISRAGQSGSIAIAGRSGLQALYPARNPLESLPDASKIELMKQLDAEARAADPRVKQVTISLVAAHDTILVMDNEGNLAADVRPLVRCSVNVIVEQNGRREQANAGGGSRTDLHYFIEAQRGLDYAREAVRQALVNLEAVDTPAGAMTVVLGPGWPGILLHEAVGHGLEGDFNRKGLSAFSNRIGEQVASPLCTIVDDGALPERRGSLTIDDEGTPGQNTVLIENGILKGYMQDKFNARLMGMQATGNGRRESYAHLPLPRMTNTYMLPGKQDPGEILGSVKNGLYAVNFSGGQVDITSGKFVFSLSEAYLIEDGKITAPVKGATLIGNGPEVLTRVSMVGNDLQLDPGVGTCGKDGQSVPVGVGQPTLKVDEITVGGTAL